MHARANTHTQTSASTLTTFEGFFARRETPQPQNIFPAVTGKIIKYENIPEEDLTKEGRNQEQYTILSINEDKA